MARKQRSRRSGELAVVGYVRRFAVPAPLGSMRVRRALSGCGKRTHEKRHDQE